MLCICLQKINQLKTVNVSDCQIDAIKLRKISETGNLESQLNLKFGSQVMITSNIDINDRLINGIVGRVTQFKYLMMTVQG